MFKTTLDNFESCYYSNIIMIIAIKMYYNIV